MTKDTQHTEKAHDLAKWIISVNGNVSHNEITELAALVVSAMTTAPSQDMQCLICKKAVKLVGGNYICCCTFAPTTAPIKAHIESYHHMRGDLGVSLQNDSKEKALEDFKGAKGDLHTDHATDDKWYPMYSLKPETVSTIEVALQSPRTGDDVPDGYVLVPVEPTDRMYEAGKEAIKQCRLEGIKSEAAYVYVSMLNAAPKSDGGA